jgi:hypothetical protein
MTIKLVKERSDVNMKLQNTRQKAILGVLAVLLLTTSCTAKLRNKQLEHVAKDWALVIRASQMIPVYPLSEDLQPGDVLLVSTPIEEQVAIYKKKGFLPLDQHLVRLYPTDFQPISYHEFYKSRYGVTRSNVPPEHWQAQGADGKHNWKAAPGAAFPSYQFAVRTGTGLNLAIPIQGVPFALGLMNSGRASGTVTIADVHTFGLDNFNIEKLVRDWAKDNRKFLRSYEPRENRSQFLRVISRVYVTGSVSVTLKNDEATSAEAAAGADRPVKLMMVKEDGTAANYTEAIKNINDLAKDQLPGAKVKVATASSRSVTMNEEFDRPLVVGYVGFDMPILRGGRLGAPISTLLQLTGKRPPPVRSSENVYRLAMLAHIYTALNDDSIQEEEEEEEEEAERIRAALDALDSLLPNRYPFSSYVSAPPCTVREDPAGVVAGVDVQGEGFYAVTDFLGYAQDTAKKLESYLECALRGTAEEKAAVSKLEGELQAARAALEDLDGRLRIEPVLMEAIDFVFLGN